MRTRRSGGEPETATTEDEEDLVIDLRERLAPYEFEHVGNPQWRETLIAADQRRLKRRIIRRFALR
jgi:hypothetical protein